MNDKTEAQPEALRLAERIEGDMTCQGDAEIAAELRRQHAEIQQLKAQLSARQAAPDGWRLVPLEPTVAQINAAHARGFFRALSIPLYDAMLSAAPPAPEREPQKGATNG
ncbi:hypothetical protein [Comamonas sp.]|uniref:hypothetical protein n=1 Tax=Comamonas sp. TaxID=34028 RepID=UPI0028AAD322|nr:hypothetical protein [Comamonas sp.]